MTSYWHGVRLHAALPGSQGRHSPERCGPSASRRPTGRSHAGHTAGRQGGDTQRAAGEVARCINASVFREAGAASVCSATGSCAGTTVALAPPPALALEAA